MKRKVRVPSVSVITPTLNSGRTISKCLSSIKYQKYAGKIEIIIADGGSTDSTLSIAKQHNARVVKNKLKTGEAGKAVGAKFAKGDILAFIDSDNVLPNKDWMSKMITPFLENSDIVATEPLYFTYRKEDHWLTRYFALLGMGDPLNLFIGNYDRYSYMSGVWTEIALAIDEKKDYLTLFLSDNIPTIGANGFLIRKEALSRYPVKNYLFDIDVLQFLAQKGTVKVAKVNVGIVHLFSGNVATFIRKQRRRVRDFLFFRKLGVRARGGDRKMIIFGVVKFILFCITGFPLLLQMCVGFIRRKDAAWLFHPVACWLTLVVYGFETLRTPFIDSQFSRRGWSQ